MNYENNYIVWEGSESKAYIKFLVWIYPFLPMNFQSFSSLFSTRYLGRFIWPCFAVSLAATQSLSAGSAKALNIQIVVDNDFALFSGSSAGVNTLLYQNNDIWNSQGLLESIADAPATDNVYYLLAMGGGSPEEAFGTIGTFNLTTALGVKVSNNLAGSLSGYNLGAVTDGSYTPSLGDVQAAFSTITFSAPPAPGCSTVCNNFPGLSNGKSFLFDGGTAVLFAIPYGGSPAAVPGPLPILGVLSAFQMSRRIRRRIRRIDG
ncbi:MAG: hypothetical protein NT158_09965 [Cyanobacteria bacterium]|nr:hypothetical protein [Cyanobacteriota bacterium]